MPFVYQNQTTIEKTPNYFSSEFAAKRVYDLNPKMKLIIIIRNPIIRAISHFAHDLKYRWNQDLIKVLNSYNATGTLFETIVLDEVGELRMPLHYFITYGIYVNNFKKWLKYFPQQQFHFVNGENFIKNPFEEMKEVENFLNLKPFIERNHFIFNATKGFYCLNINLNTSKILCMNENKGRSHPKIEQWVINKLNEFYKPYSLELFKMLNQEPFWDIF